MTTNNSAAAALSGDPAAAPAASAVPAGDAGAGGGEAAIAAAAAAAINNATPAGDAGASNDAWYSKLENADVRTWAEAKGFKDPLAAAESAYNLEKLMGFDKAGRTIVLPDENSTPEQIAAFRAKLGVPETADGYKLPVPQGVPEDFAKEASGWFHEAGVPPKAAEAIAAKWNAKMEAAQAAANQAFETQSNAEFAAWRAEQGAAADQNQELAKRAAAQFMPAKDAAERAEMMSKIERAIGTGNFMKMMTNIGSGLGEHKVHMGGEGGLTPTPAQAQQRIAELKSNKEWTSAYLGGDKTKQAEMEQLQKLAYPEVSNG